MKSALTHRVSTILATALATAALATGVATAETVTLDPIGLPVPVPTGSAALDTAESVLSTGSGNASTAFTSGSAVANWTGQILCKLEGGTWDPTTPGCKVGGGFHPTARTVDTAPPTAELVATTTGSGSSSSADLLPKALVCQLTGNGRYWSSQYGCTDVPPWLD